MEGPAGRGNLAGVRLLKATSGFSPRGFMQKGTAMSGSISNFLDDVRDEIEGAIDDAATEVGDAADDVRSEVNGNDDTTATPTAPATPSTPAAPAATDEVRTAQVTRLYDTVFDRPPDAEGLTFWTNALRTGTVELDDVAELFVASPEFRNTYGDLGAGEFVDRLYLNVLDRPADPDGRQYWVSSIESGRADRDDVVLAFSESPEHVAKVGPAASADDPLV